MQPKRSSSNKFDYDLIIVGGGMVGAALACSLSGKGLKLAIVEAVEFNQSQQPSYDDRGITLSLSSQRVFQGMGLWQGIAQYANPIKHIHVSEQGSFASVRLNASDVNLAELAFVIPAKQLGQCLLEQVKQAEDIDFLCPAELHSFELHDEHASVEVKQHNSVNAYTAGLLIAADGSFSSIRQQAGLATRIKDYGQSAIVCNITTQRANNNTAYERFTTHGPLAVLPLRDKDAVCVYTVARNDSAYFMQCDEDTYSEQLLKEFGLRLGKIEKIGQRRSYPLRLVECNEQAKRSLIILGNAAHTIHPNAAQGFNLALRDVAGLAECVLEAKQDNELLSNGNLQKRYLAMREKDQQNIIQFTDSLTELFYNDSRFKKFTRRLAMTGLEKLPLLKRELIKRGMGVADRQPKLVRGLAL